MVTVYVSSKDVNAKQIEEQSTPVKSLKWKDNEINYVLGDKGCNLSLDELLKIAENIIKAK